MTSPPMTRDEEEQQLVTCFCTFDQTGNATLTAWGKCDRRSSLMTSFPSLYLSPQRRCSPKATKQLSACTFLDPFVTNSLRKDTRTGFLLDARIIFCVGANNLNMATPQDNIAMDAINQFIISFDDSIPSYLCTDIYSPQQWRTSAKHAACCDSDNVTMLIMEHSTAQRPSSHIISSEDAERENAHTHGLGRHRKSCEDYNFLKEASARNKRIKMKKSVSFDEDVMVYLFDQESPTLELHSDFGISQSNSCPCNLQKATSEDTGLQWEDDLSALENSCHFQYPSKQSYTLSTPTRGWTAPSRPERCPLSQTCLFLTYVTESDLEL